jgi:hypothetical protein
VARAEAAALNFAYGGPGSRSAEAACLAEPAERRRAAQRDRRSVCLVPRAATPEDLVVVVDPQAPAGDDR